jgi:O-antigen/teichoic acid export membrane protein
MTSGIYLVIIFNVYNDGYKILLCCILAFQFLGNIFNFEWMNEANENYLFISLKSIFVRVLYLIGIFIFVKQSNDIIWYAVLLIGSVVLNTLLSYLYIRKKHKFNFENFEIKKHLKPLFFIFLITNIALLYTQADKIILGKLVSESEVTAYQVSQYISGLIYGLLIPIINISIPRISNMIKNDNLQDVYSLYRKVIKIFLFMFIPATVGVFMLSKEIIIIYGSYKYTDCIPVLACFALAQFSGAWCYIFGDAMLLLCNKEKQLVLFNIIGGFFNVLFDFILYFTGHLNAVNAVIKLIVSYLIVDILSYMLLVKLFRKDNIKFTVFDFDFLKHFLISLLFIPVIIISKLIFSNLLIYVLFSIISCIILYSGLLFLTKDKNMSDLIMRVRRKMQ